MSPAERRSLARPRLPAWAPALAGSLACALAALLGLLFDWTLTGSAIAAAALYFVLLPTWSALVENRRAATDRCVTGLVWLAFTLAMLPLFSLLVTVTRNGLALVDLEFLTYSMRNVVGDGGGIYHAIAGTLQVTLAAAVMSVPLGLLTAIYLVEYGNDTRLSRWVTSLVDVMTGIPSIVAGLFAYALFVLFFGEGVRLGIGGAVALSLLMIPVVVRSSEESLKLVPDDLREAALALGVPRWRMITRVVLPTAMSGLVTAVTLAVARVIGETAPLLIIAGKTDSTNFNLFDERMATVPVFIYYSYTQPGVPAEIGQDRAWGAAFILIAIVLTLNVCARLIGRRLSASSDR